MSRTRQDQFVGAVEASAQARTLTDLDGQDGHPKPATDYIGPAVMESDYLDGAVNPAARTI